MEDPSKDVLGPSGWTDKKKNSRGVTLWRFFWPAQKPLGVAVIVHGHGSHLIYDFLAPVPEEGSHYKDSFVEMANKKRLSVCGIDFESHGRSESATGDRCYVDRFQYLVDDVAEFMKDIKDSDIPKFSKLPMFLVGASMGGGVVVNVMHQNKDIAKGAVLLAPMLRLEKVTKVGLNRFLRPVAWLISQVLPKAQVAKMKPNEKFPDIQTAFDEDPYCYHEDTRARMAEEYLQAVDRTMKEMPNMEFPFITFHSREDENTDFEGSEMLVNLSKSTDKTLREVNDMWHFLLKEPGCENVKQTSIEWMLQRLK